MISLFRKNHLSCIKSDLKVKYGTVERIGSLKGKFQKFNCIGWDELQVEKQGQSNEIG